MNERDLTIRTPDGVADAVLYFPDGQRRPGVLHLTDIGGIRPSHREMAKRLAAAGYAVLMPNVFYRSGKPPFLAFPVNPADEKTRKRIGELGAPLTPEAIERDAAAYVDQLAAERGVEPGPMAVVGYCFTGKMALRAAATRPEQIRVALSFHGGGLWTDLATSPHLVLPRVKARLYFGHAVDDHSMPGDAIERFDRALASWGGRYQSEVYDKALHGWTVPDSAAFNPPQAERAFAKLAEVLAAELR